MPFTLPPGGGFGGGVTRGPLSPAPGGPFGSGPISATDFINPGRAGAGGTARPGFPSHQPQQPIPSTAQPQAAAPPPPVPRGGDAPMGMPGGGAGGTGGAFDGGPGGLDLTSIGMETAQQPMMQPPSMQALGARDSNSGNYVERPSMGTNPNIGMRVRPMSMRTLAARAY